MPRLNAVIQRPVEGDEDLALTIVEIDGVGDGGRVVPVAL
jgi:hypothetical protein